MSYDPRDHALTGRDGVAGAAVWLLVLSMLVLAGDCLPDQRALGIAWSGLMRP